MKRLKRFLLFSFLALISIIVLGGVAYGVYYLSQPRPASPPPPADTRDGRWQQDLTYLSTELTRLHANVAHTVSRAEFEQALARLAEAIPTLDDREIAIRIMALVAMVGDAHTSASISWGSAPFYPYTMSWFSEGAFVTGASEAYAHLVGSEMLKIGDVSIDEAFRRVSTIISHENEPKLRGWSPFYLRSAEVLHALDLLPQRDRGQFVFRTVEGDTVSLELPALPEAQWRQKEWVRATSDQPLFRQRRDELFWFEYLEDQRLLFFKYNRCREPWAFWRFSRKLRRFLDEHDVDKLVIDFRLNAGGNSFQFANLFLDDLKTHETLNRRGRLFAVIDRYTYSSAMLNAAQLHQQTEAILIGESSSGKPNGYGEMRDFTLPNSSIRINYSTRYIEAYPDLGEAPSFEPDIHIPVTVQAYLAGQDPVMEAILAYEK